jgi:hypothetical protein
MKLKEIIGRISDPYWLREVHSLLDLRLQYAPTETESKNDLSFVVAECANHLRKSHRGRACNWAVLGMIFFPEAFLAMVRREGHLRPSRYGFEGATAEFVACELLQHGEAIGLLASARAYLESIVALHGLAMNVREEIRFLINSLAEGKETTLKGLLAVLDLVFMKPWLLDRRKTSSEIQFYSVEELAEGFSFLVHLYYENVGIPKQNTILDDRPFLAGEYERMLVSAARVRVFQESEVFVDVLDYKLTLAHKPHSVTLSAPVPELDKAYRLGLIQTLMAKPKVPPAGQQEEVLTLEKAGSDLYGILGTQFVGVKEHPAQRYVFSFPLAEPLQKLLNQDQFFADELRLLDAASRDLMIPIRDLLDFLVTPDVSIRDLLRVQRLLNLVRYYAVAHMLPRLQTARGMVFRSLVPYFSIEGIRELLGFVLPAGKVMPVVEFLTWGPGQRSVFDIQYQPLLKTGEGWLVPLNVLGSSNIIRNALCLSRRRLHAGAKGDPLAPMITAALHQYTEHVGTTISYSFSETDGEVDVIALFGGFLFAFECKNSLLPASPYEIRTSYDHIVRAARQLSRFAELYRQNEFRDYLAARLRWPIGHDTQLVTCIIVGNRMFPGLRLEGHAVRASYEMANFITTGTIIIAGNEVRLWSGPSFSGEDFRRYIQEDLLHRPAFDAMEDCTEEYVFGESVFRCKTYVLNMVALARQWGLTIDPS